MIIDPIDGTRPLMYDMDSSYILTGIAPNKGEKTSLQDIEIAIQTEIPTTRQYLADFMYTTTHQTPIIEEWNILTGKKEREYAPKPTKSKDLTNGFAMFAKFFRGKDVSAEIEERLFRELFGNIKQGKAEVFDHQYISSAGQLANLMKGKYRFCADIRPLTEKILNKKGDKLGLCAHPYDLCTELIARQTGIIITDEYNNPLNPPLDTKTNVSWIGYANKDIKELVQPLLTLS